MDYVFSMNGGVEYVRTPASIGKISGRIEVLEEYHDSTVTHYFNVGRKVKEGSGFVWYEINNHVKIVDKTNKLLDILRTENESLRQQVDEQSDALIELAEMIVGGD